MMTEWQALHEAGKGMTRLERLIVLFAANCTKRELQRLAKFFREYSKQPPEKVKATKRREKRKRQRDAKKI